MDETKDDQDEVIANENYESTTLTRLGSEPQKSFGSKISIDALCSYVPASIIRFLSENASSDKSRTVTAPWRHSYETVALFADVSGFTDLSERLAMKGREGSEQLAKHLNSYFEQLVRVIASQGGDVFKFAGDALLVLWPPSEDDLCTVTRRAVQSALEIQRKMHNAKLQEDVVLSVKLGIGVGTCSIVHVGGVLSRMEYLATGSPLMQAFASEHKAVAGQVVCSPEAWHIIKDHFVAQVISSGHAFVHRCTDRLRKVGIVKTANLDIINDVKLIESISNYVPGAVLPFLNATEERWASELRHVAVIFANLGFTEAQLAKIASEEATDDLDRVQAVIFSVQTAIYQYEGSVNKFLLDDKGSTLVAVFGLPPVAHEDDSSRAILASLVMCNQLHRLGVVPAIGITTGTAFCGVVGSRSRREYSVLGDVVNLSARLMQHAKTKGGGVLVDQTTQYSSRNGMAFEELPSIMVKGKREAVKVFSPIASSVAPHGIWNHHKNADTNSSAKPFPFVHSLHNPHAELSRTMAGNFSTSLTTQSPLKEAAASEMIPQALSLSSLWATYCPRVSSSIQVYEKAINAANWVPTISPQKQSLSISLDFSELLSVNSVNPAVVSSKGTISGSTGPTAEDLAWAEHARNWLQEDEDAPAVNSPKFSQLNESETWYRKVDRTSTNGPLVSIGAEQRINSSLSSISNSTLSSPTEDLSPEGPFWDYSSDNTRTTLGHYESKSRQTDVNGINNSSASTLHPYKMARFQILDTGYVTVNCSNLTSVYQVKERLFENLKKKHMLPLNSSIDQFTVHIADTNVLMQNEHIALSVLPKLNGIGSSPELDFILARKPDVDEHVVADDMCAADIIQMLCKAMMSVTRGHGSATYIIEGEAGYGKSRLLAQVVREAPAFVLFRACNPLESKFPLGIWRELFMQLIDTEIANRAFQYSGDPAHRRRAFTLKSMSIIPDYVKYAGVLNDLLPLEFEETEETLSMSSLERRSNSTAIMLGLLQIFVKQIGTVIIVIDDALLMDKLSWGFTFRVSSGIENVLIVLGTRPMNKSNLGAFDLEVPADYTDLLKQDTTKKCTLRALTNEEIYNIGIETLGVTKLPNTLAVIILQRSHGNPLVCKEFIYSLRKNELIQIRTEKGGKICTLSDKFTDLSVVPVPICLQNILGCRIDRLGHIHEIALKVASVIGAEFQMDLLLKAYPIAEHIPQLHSVVSDMCSLNVFAATENGLQNSNVYRFVDGFMRDVALSRLIVSQKQLLLTRISEAKTKNTLFTKSTDLQVQGSVKFSGFLHVRKALDPSNVSSTMRMRMGTWKHRWVVLHENSISLYYHPTHPRVLGVIFLDNSSVSMLPGSSFGRDFTIQIQAQYWMKKGTANYSKRLFYMAAATLEDARDWSYKIAVTIEKQLSVRERHAVQASISSEMQRENRDLWTPDFTNGIVSNSGFGDVPSINLPDSISDTNMASLPALRAISQSSITGDAHNGFSSSAQPPSKTFRSSFASSVMYLSRRLKTTHSNTGSIRRSLLSLKLNGRGQSVEIEPSMSMNSSISEVGQQRSSWRPAIELDGISLPYGVKDHLIRWLFQGNSFVTTEDHFSDSGVLRPLLSESAILKSGYLYVLDQLAIIDDDKERWRKRWVCVSSDTLAMSSSQFDDDISCAVCFGTSRIKKLPDMLVIKVESNLSLEGPVVIYDKEVSVVLRAEDSSDYEGWVDLICRLQEETSQLSGQVTSDCPEEELMGESNSGLQEVNNVPVGNCRCQESSYFARVASQIIQRLINEMDSQENFSKDAIRSEIGDLQSVMESFCQVCDNGEFSPLPSDPAEPHSAVAHNSISVLPEEIGDIENYRSADWFLKMMDECDIDESTKQWLAQCYTLDGRDDINRSVRTLSLNESSPATVRSRRRSKVNSLGSASCESGDDSPVNDTSSQRLSLNAMQLSTDLDFQATLSAQPSSSVDDVPSFETLFSWEFDIFLYDKSYLTRLLIRMFEGLDFLNTFKIDFSVMSAFVTMVADSYMDNPYHNLFHSVDTTQTVCCLLRSFSGNAFLSPLETFALVIASACHDIGHPGLGNSYQVNASTKLALLYNDQAVLEQHHCALTFRLLKRPEANVLSNLSPTEYRQIRKIIISSILATDMTCHFSLSEKFFNLLVRHNDHVATKSRRSGSSPLSSRHPSVVDGTQFSATDREIIVNMFLHASDISNQCKSWSSAKRWSDCILIELFHQGDIERSSDMTISPNCDRHSTDRLQFTLNFIDFVVAPLFVSLTQLLPTCIVACSSLRSNRRRWDSLLLQTVAQSSLPAEKKREEENRWRRRMASFDEILMFEVGDGADLVKKRKSSIQLVESFVRANSSSQGAGVSRRLSKDLRVDRKQMQPIIESSSFASAGGNELGAETISDLEIYPPLELGQPPDPPFLTDPIVEADEDSHLQFISPLSDEQFNSSAYVRNVPFPSSTKQQQDFSSKSERNINDFDAAHRKLSTKPRASFLNISRFWSNAN